VLGRVGLSIGLALEDNPQGMTRVGADHELSAEQRATKLKAFERCVHALPEAVKEADVVAICVEVDQVKAVLEIICDDLKPGAVVLDTSPLTVPVLEWARDILPAENHLIKFIPSLNPEMTAEVVTDPEKASSDLFKKGTILIAAEAEVGSDAFHKAGEMVDLLGASPLYTDPFEADGLIAMANLLPELAALALMRTVNTQPGWRESQRIAGSEFDTATQSLLTQEKRRQPGQAALLNAENSARLLGDLISQLKAIQAMLAAGDADALRKAYQDAAEKRGQWVTARHAAKWSRMDEVELPRRTGLFGMFGPARREKDKSEKS
jgi:prephenate dehydrogenase